MYNVTVPLFLTAYVKEISDLNTENKGVRIRGSLLTQIRRLQATSPEIGYLTDLYARFYLVFDLGEVWDYKYIIVSLVGVLVN